MKIIRWVKAKTVPLSLLLVIIGFCALPIIKHPPSHRQDKRILWQIHGQTRKEFGDQNEFIEGRHGPIRYYGKEILNSKSSDCPFVWFTSPPSGVKIQALDPIKHDWDNPPAGFVKRFYVAARDADWFNGRWVLLNTGEPRYVKDSQIDWDSQMIKE